MPEKLHITVPTGFRRNSKIPKVLVLHYDNLPERDTEAIGGVRVTKALRTVLDLLATGDVPPSVLRQALREGLRRGLIRRSEISEAKNHLRDNKKARQFLLTVAA
jgi:hypothetical protein